MNATSLEATLRRACTIVAIALALGCIAKLVGISGIRLPALMEMAATGILCALIGR